MTQKNYFAKRNYSHTPYFNLSSFIFFKNDYNRNVGAFVHVSIYLKSILYVENLYKKLRKEIFIDIYLELCFP